MWFSWRTRPGRGSSITNLALALTIPTRSEAKTYCMSWTLRWGIQQLLASWGYGSHLSFTQIRWISLGIEKSKSTMKSTLPWRDPELPRFWRRSNQMLLSTGILGRRLPFKWEKLWPQRYIYTFWTLPPCYSLYRCLKLKVVYVQQMQCVV